MDKTRNPRSRHPLFGRHPLTLGALALLGLSGYELWIRVENFWAWTRGIRHLSQVCGMPIWKVFSIIFEVPAMRMLGYKMLFLMFAIIFALVCVICRNRAGGAPVLLAMDIALTGCGAWLRLYSLRFTDWAQTLKLVPLGLIAVGCVINIAQGISLRRGSGQRR